MLREAVFGHPRTYRLFFIFGYAKMNVEISGTNKPGNYRAYLSIKLWATKIFLDVA